MKEVCECIKKEYLIDPIVQFHLNNFKKVRDT